MPLVFFRVLFGCMFHSCNSSRERVGTAILTFVVTLTTFKDVRSYPCRSLESATKLAERFIAGVTKPRPFAPEQLAPVAEPVAA